MKHVRLTLDGRGREDEIHPMYDLLVNAACIDRATAMHWNYTGEELGIMHYIEGDVGAFREAIEDIPPVLEYDLTTVDDETFYVYIRDATNEPLRALFDVVDRSPVVVIPPVEYAADGTVSYSVVGPAAQIQAAIEAIPDPIEISVGEIGAIETMPGILDTVLSDRQREAIEAALALGYYEIPREASVEDIARDVGCAPSTAAEHVQKAESKLLRSVLADRRSGT